MASHFCKLSSRAISREAALEAPNPNPRDGLDLSHLETAENRELALWRLVNRLVPENA
jgi:hypothetical protein